MRLDLLYCSDTAYLSESFHILSKQRPGTGCRKSQWKIVLHSHDSSQPKSIPFRAQKASLLPPRFVPSVARKTHRLAPPIPRVRGLFRGLLPFQMPLPECHKPAPRPARCRNPPLQRKEMLGRVACDHVGRRMVDIREAGCSDWLSTAPFPCLGHPRSPPAVYPAWIERHQ